MVQISLSNTYIYGIIYAIIFIMFIVAFASQPYLTISSKHININAFYTNIELQVSEDIINEKTKETKRIYHKEKYMIIKGSNTDFYLILILSIIIFVSFGCSFLTLFLNAKKLNKFFNIIILLAMIIIIIAFHVSIYDSTSKYSKLIVEINGDEYSTIKTTKTAGYGLTLTCMILMFLTIVSSFIY